MEFAATPVDNLSAVIITLVGHWKCFGYIHAPAVHVASDDYERTFSKSWRTRLIGSCRLANLGKYRR